MVINVLEYSELLYLKSWDFRDFWKTDFLKNSENLENDVFVLTMANLHK